jgi:hypothetical protein
MSKPENGSTSRLSAAGWIAIVVMLGILAWAAWDAMGAWHAMQGVHMSVLGWVFLSAGVIVTFLVGGGLMALLFYSSRHNMDI